MAEEHRIARTGKGLEGCEETCRFHEGIGWGYCSGSAKATNTSGWHYLFPKDLVNGDVPRFDFAFRWPAPVMNVYIFQGFLAFYLSGLLNRGFGTKERKEHSGVITGRKDRELGMRPLDAVVVELGWPQERRPLLKAGLKMAREVSVKGYEAAVADVAAWIKAYDNGEFPDL